MTQEPRTQDQIYRSIRDKLTSSIAGLTNFTERSFNYIFTQSYADEIRALEIQALAAQLSGYIDYADGNLTEDDLVELGIDDVVSDPAEINQYMDDANLDALVQELGVTRDNGSRATGEVRFTTQAAETTIPEGTVVTTELDSDGNSLPFETTETAETIDGVTVVEEVPIQSLEPGEEYNLPEGEIVRVQSPPVGVTGVINTISTTGGEGIESNESLRTRGKQALESAGEGGTVAGVRSYIRNNVEGVTTGNVLIDEFVDEQPPFVDVIVDGGLDEEVEAAIDESRPTGIRHNLVRPKIIQLAVDANVQGTNITTSTVSQFIEDFLLSLGVSEEFYNDQLIRAIFNSDEDIFNIESLRPIIERVSNERFTYDSSQSTYRLEYTYEDTYGTISVTDENDFEYEEGVNFQVIDDTGDGFPETIEWIGVTPSDGDTFSVDYDVTNVEESLDDEFYFTNTVRDEPIVYNLGREETFTYDDNRPVYDLSSRPYDGTVTIEQLDSDGNPTGETFTRGESWQLAPLADDGVTDTFTFSTTQSQYPLSSKQSGAIAIIDENKNIYREDVDYTTIDTDSDTIADTVEWDTDVDEAIAEDGGSFTTQTTEATDSTEDDMTLLPATPSVDDAYYFGNSAAFDYLELDISTAGDGTWSITWEYWDGSSWTALDAVSDNTNAFRASGVNSVTWSAPSDWSARTVNGKSGLYWIRARVDSYTSITTQPLGKEVLFGEEPDDTTEFTVNYGCCAQSIRWGQSGDEPEPTSGLEFTVTYDQQVYQPEYEMVSSIGNTITDESGDTYVEDTDYVTFDADGDNEVDSIFWLSDPATLDDGEEFYYSYVTEGDINIGDREKVDPGTITVSVE